MKRAPISPMRITRKGFTFEWHGGTYIEIMPAGSSQAFEVINTTRTDGELPDFSRINFELELEDVDYSELRNTLREMRY